ncbi:MAG: OmpA family protein [Saprospiraceae bacterium]|nr:OmpA family protein [Lewinella sp.]
MTRRITLAAVLILALLINANAQKGKSKNTGPKPRNMWEIGANGGYLFYSGDVPSEFGWAAGVHFRKSLDHAFSLRADLLYGMAQGDNGTNRMFDSKWTSGTIFGILSMNNFSIDRRSRKFNYYIMIGAGVNRFETNYVNEGTGMSHTERERGTIMMDMAPHMAPGAGFAVRLNKRLNIGAEYQGMILFGRRADLLDGTELEKGIRSPFRDIANYLNLRINYNIGNPSRKSEPLYWVSPGDVVFNELDELKKQQDEAFQDSDKDGVIDLLDQEDDTPPNAEVDTKGRTLDSDKDGVPNYRDKEPYYPPRAGEEVDDDGVVINPMPRPGAPGAGGVTEERVREIVDEVLSGYNLSESGSTVADWFLPMIHFGTNSSTVKYSDYGTLAGIARMMTSNPSLRLVVEGHTDQTGGEAVNAQLSYERAKAVVDLFETNYGISRGRFVILWKGKDVALVPQSSSYMNRRVEFRAAGPNDYEMAPPSAGEKQDGY